MNDKVNHPHFALPARIDRRGVHLDLKGLPPTFDRLMALLEIMGEMRFNILMIEWEDMFPWSFDPALRHPCHYTPQQVARIAERCEQLNIELIPLVQSLGHMEFVLQHKPYHELCECQHNADSLHPLHTRSSDLVQNMIDDVLSLIPNVKHFHLGGDEVWSFGSHPDSKAFIAEHGKGELYLHHMRPLLDNLNDRGIRPILWHDMMIDWPIESLHRVAHDADLMVWGYRGTPEMRTHHHRTEVLDRMRDAGVPIWGAGAYKGADGPFRDLPQMEARCMNHLGWVDAADSYELRGVVTTGWSRYATGRVQGEPIDACLRELAMASLILHNGCWPDDGETQCDQLLKAAGEFDRVERLRRHFEKADAKRDEAWTIVRQIKEHLANMQVDPGHPTAGTLGYLNDALESLVQQIETECVQVPSLLGGLICEPYIYAYQLTWSVALRNEADTLAVRVAEILPQPNLPVPQTNSRAVPV